MMKEWVTYPRPNPSARLRLFCFPYAGGGASVFYSWAEGLPSEVELCPIQLPGRESRLSEPPFIRLPPLVQTLALAIGPHLDKPFAFFGHSMGATIAFELARRLREQGGPTPLCLIVSGGQAPHLPDPAPPIHYLPEEEFITELRRLNGTPDAVLRHAELLQLFLPLLRADLAMYETYEYVAGEPLECPVFAFGGYEDQLVDWKDLASWQEQTSGSFALHMFSGDHFFLRSAQKDLLQTISQELTKISVQKGRR
jgi:medium-chain acyl-[acyl-carrier-protein] hydrolase